MSHHFIVAELIPARSSRAEVRNLRTAVQN